MKIKDISKAYCIGIKGAGMVAMVQILRSRGIAVSGSDTKEVFYTDAILKRGNIPFYEDFSASHVPQDADVVIYSTAYNEENNEEMAQAKKMKIPMASYPEMLGLLFAEKLGIAVCGTHGKTTTSAMLSEALAAAGLDPSAIVGSQVTSWQGSALVGKGDYFVAEADEYQNKLAHYKPWSVILTSVDWDHPDFFPDPSAYKEVFKEFVKKIPHAGYLVVWGDSSDTLEVAENTDGAQITYGFGDDNDYRIKNYAARNTGHGGEQEFEVFHGEESLGIFETSLVGKHNALNATAVIAFCNEMNLDMDKVKKALRDFKGTSRRFEQVGFFGDAMLIDDYAHHPDEIKATLKGARELFADKNIWTVFHPHTFTRTKALLSDFAQSFENTDMVIVIDIYGSAREKQGGVSSADLAALINKYHPNRAYHIPTIDEAAAFLKENAGRYDVLITMGAGDVWKIGEKLKTRAA